MPITETTKDVSQFSQILRDIVETHGYELGRGDRCWTIHTQPRRTFWETITGRRSYREIATVEKSSHFPFPASSDIRITQEDAGTDDILRSIVGEVERKTGADIELKLIKYTTIP